MQERLIASVSEISTLKQEITRLNQYIATNASRAAQATENVRLSVVEEEPAEEAVSKISPEIIVDMSDI